MNETINANRSICATRGEDPRAFPSVTSDTVSENPQISWYSWDYILPASSIVLTMKTNSQRKALTWITFLSRWWSTCQVGVQKVLALELHLFHLHSYWSGPDTKSKLEKNSHNWIEWWLMHIICKTLVISYFQWWSVTKYNYFVTVLKYIFQVSVLYWSSFILSNFYFYFTTFQSIRSYFLLHYIS